MTNRKRLSSTELEAAMLAPEEDVTQPTRKRAASFTSRLAALDVGEVASRIKQLDGNLRLSDLASDITSLRAAFRNNTAPSVRAASDQTGGEYATEVSEFITGQGYVYLVVVVTRIN